MQKIILAKNTELSLKFEMDSSGYLTCKMLLEYYFRVWQCHFSKTYSQTEWRLPQGVFHQSSDCSFFSCLLKGYIVVLQHVPEEIENQNQRLSVPGTFVGNKGHESQTNFYNNNHRTPIGMLAHHKALPGCCFLQDASQTTLQLLHKQLF